MCKHNTELPDNVNFETEFGVMELSHLYTDADFHGIALTGKITVNRVEIQTRLSLADYGDGFELYRDSRGGSTWIALSTYRTDNYRQEAKATDTSDADRKKIIEKLVPAVNAWAKGKESLFVKARKASVAIEIDRLGGQVADAEDQVVALKAKVAEHEERYADIR